MLGHGLQIPVDIPLQPGMVDARRSEQKYLRRNASLCKCVSELGDVIAVQANLVVHVLLCMHSLLCRLTHRRSMHAGCMAGYAGIP
jgi:hypothetical protein